MKENLQQDLIKELFDYNPDTGILTWKVARSNVKVGQEAGCLRTDGYRVVGINGHNYQVSSIIWLFMTGHLPVPSKGEQIFRRGLARDNNRWKNLRLTT